MAVFEKLSGDAVHAVLGYLKHRKTITSSTPTGEILAYAGGTYGETYAALLRIQKIPGLEARLWECWQYIANLCQASDCFEVEPELVGFKPDLVLWQKGTVYVVDIKTRMLIFTDESGKAFHDPEHELKGLRQTYRPLRYLRWKYQRPGNALLLFFNTYVGRPMNPTWVHALSEVDYEILA